MLVFRLDPSRLAHAFQARGHCIAAGGVTPEFLAFARAQARARIESREDLEEWRIRGKKLQFLFEFPPEVDHAEHVLRPLAEASGHALGAMTLAERHIKAYDDTAPSHPTPHKDRLASQITVGIPLEVPAGSHIVLYPDQCRDTNPYGSSAVHRESLDEEELPERVLAGIEPLRLDVQPGSVVLFQGHSIWHERVNPARAVLLYLKLNAMRLDPLGEDPRTPVARAASLERLHALDDAALLASVIEVSPRLERASRHYTRDGWREVLHAHVWGQREFRIGELELRVLREADGRRTIAEVLGRTGVDASDARDAVRAIRRLVRLNALDLVCE